MRMNPRRNGPASYLRWREKRARYPQTYDLLEAWSVADRVEEDLGRVTKTLVHHRTKWVGK